MLPIRQQLTASYRATQTGRPQLVLIEAATPSQGAQLRDDLAAELGQERVLAASCRLHDHRPYRGLGDLVLELVGHPAPGGCAPVLAQSFPGLTAPGSMAHSLPPSDPPTQEASVRVQRQLFAIRDLLAARSGAASLVCWMDNAQWADEDTARVLKGLWSLPGSPPVLWVGTATEPRGPLVEAFKSPPLPERQRQVLPADADGPPAPDQPANALPPWSRRALAVLCVARGPVPQSVLLEAAPHDGDALPLLEQLQTTGWVQSSPVQPEAQLLLGDEATRQALSLEFGERELQPARATLIRALQAHEHNVDAGLLFEQYRADGQLDRALEQAPRAAREAGERMAYGMQAELWCWLAHHDDAERRGFAWEQAARAQSRAGRGRRAAQSALTAARMAHDDAASWRRQLLAAQLLTHHGHVRRALPLLREVLSRRGVSWPAAGLPGLAATLLRPVPRSAGDERRPLQETILACDRSDALETALAATTLFDSVRTVSFSRSWLREASRTGDARRMGRAAASHAALLAVRAPRGRDVRQWLQVADEAARATNDAQLWAETRTAAAVQALWAGKFARALTLGDEAERALSACEGSFFQLAAARSAMATALYWLGDVEQTERRVPRWIVQARARGDVVGEMLFVSHPLLLSDDDLSGAERRMRQAADLAHRHLAQGVSERLLLAANVFTAMYAGKLVQARTHARRALSDPELRVLRFSPAIDAHFGLVALEIDLVLRQQSPGAHERQLLRIERRAPAWMQPLASRNRAALHWRRGNAGAAVHALHGAADGFRHHGMRLYALCTELRHAELIGDSPAADRALRGLQESGIRNPERFARALAPGFEGLEA